MVYGINNETDTIMVNGPDSIIPTDATMGSKPKVDIEYLNKKAATGLANHDAQIAEGANKINYDPFSEQTEPTIEELNSRLQNKYEGVEFL